MGPPPKNKKSEKGPHLFPETEVNSPMKTTTQNTAYRSQDKTSTTSRPGGGGERRGSDVSDRLLAFTSTLLGLAGSLPEDRAGGHLAEQLLRSGTAAYFRHGEAEGSPSAKEFADKFRAALTELRISRRALQLLERAGLPCDGQAVRTALEEVDILIRIFFSSIRTLENKAAA
ncbi:MAG: four helix bundle protein [Verrucomicrobia bacterium]|nr:four helix bundle protein [Verrucomicrobiota bacterium]NBR45925.1 four helix bundle protein [Verrucomicrobiota bacterium]